MYKRIAVGLDGSEGSRRRAFEAAIDLARASKAELYLLSVEELPRYPAAVDEINGEQRAAGRFFQKVQKEATAHITGAGLVAHCEIRAGHPAQALPHYALEVGADLLVIGHAGHSAIWGRLLGTTADKIVDHAPCSVLMVR
jgi:nucleotide-binding universal stress UspA family protein